MEKYTIEDFKNFKLKSLLFNKAIYIDINNVELLSCGGTGCVYKIYINNVPYCIKLQYGNNFNDKTINICKKYDINKLLDDFICKIYDIGVVMNNKYHNKKIYYTLIEYIEGTSLSDLKLTNNNISVLMIFLLKFMLILHSNNLGYSDIKPENIMLSKDYKFKIIDIDTITNLLSLKRYSNTFTPKYYISEIKAFTSHQFNNIISCILTCLNLMNMYPQCNKKSYLQSIKEYCAYLLNVCDKLKIKKSSDVKNNIQLLVNDLYPKCNNLLYTLISILLIDILLIPRYSIAYYDANYWIYIFSIYTQFIPNEYLTCNQFCSKTVSINMFPFMENLIHDYPNRISNETDLDEEISKIPNIINYDLFMKEYIPLYINKYQIRINKFKNLFKYIENYQKYLTIDEYSFIRQDPRANVGGVFKISPYK